MPLIVLDTNVVFDWLLFADTHCEPLKLAVEQGDVRWIATPEMRDEYFHVLAHGRLDAWCRDLNAMTLAWQTHCTLVATQLPASGGTSRPRCSDVDDQMFIDLARSHRARWLLSKDRAVLKLRTKMRSFGVEVMSPRAWATARRQIEDVSASAAIRT